MAGRIPAPLPKPANVAEVASQTSQGNEAKRLTTALLLVALLLPSIITIGLEFQHRADRRNPIADLATIDLAARDAASGARSLGPYSRHHWHHPGPVYFYVLGGALLLLGRDPLTLPLTVVAIGIGAWLLSARALCRTSALQLALVAVAVSAWSYALRDVFPPTMLSARWNPIAPLVPYFALWLIAPLVARGRWAWLAPLVGLHALTTQTHIGFALPATLALVAATAWGHRYSTSSPSRRDVVLSTVVFVVAWLPLLFRTDNIVQLVEFFLAGGGSRPADFRPWTLLVEQTQAVVPGVTGAAAAALLLIQLTALAWLAWRPPRGSAETRLTCGLAVLHLLACVLTVPFVDAVGAWHSTLWVSVAGAIGWLEIAKALASLTPPRRGIAPAVASFAVAVAALHAYALPDQYRAWVVQRRIDIPIVQAMRVAALGVREGGRLRLATHEPEPGGLAVWPWLTALTLALEDDGHRPRIDPTFAFMFGSNTSYGPPDAQTLVLSAPFWAARPALVTDGPVWLYGPVRPEPPLSGRPALFEAPAPRCLEIGEAVAIGSGPLNDVLYVRSTEGSALDVMRAGDVIARLDASEGDSTFQAAHLHGGISPEPLELVARGPSCVSEVRASERVGARLRPADPDGWTAGWYPPEHDRTAAWRWMDGRDGEVVLPHVPPGRYILFIEARTHGGSEREQSLRPSVEGGALLEQRAISTQTTWASWTLSIADRTTIALRAGWAAPPGSGDLRPLSVAVHTIALVREPE